MELRVIERKEDLTFIELVGSLDLDGFQIEIKFHAYAAGRKRPTIVEMSQVDFLSSLGIRMLMSSARSLDQVGVKMALLNPQPQVERALTLAGVPSVIPIVHSEQEALEKVGVV
jgi:anti-anti-sigma factor